LINSVASEFTHIFTTNFVGSSDIRASREVFPIGVRSPEFGPDALGTAGFRSNDADGHVDIYVQLDIDTHSILLATLYA
jgi:hypothetical protein